MKLKIGNHTITTDRYNYIVSSIKEPNDKRYYGKFEEMLLGFTEQRLKRSTAKDLVSLQRSIESIHKDIDKIKQMFHRL